MKKIHLYTWVLTFFSLIGCQSGDKEKTTVLDFDDFSHYFKKFNKEDIEHYPQYIPNEKAITFLDSTIPLLDIPDTVVQKTYYFRWWTFRKHIKQTPKGFVITEFLPEVSWAGKYNTINCPAAYHIYEGRWLRDPRYMEGYINYWLTEADNLRRYSFWVADAILAFQRIHFDPAVLERQLPALIENYYAWEAERRDAPGRLFWQDDNLDGMEFSAGGRVIDKGTDRASTIAARPTINSYMYADAVAISRISAYLGEEWAEKEFAEKSSEIQELVTRKLWNDSLNFFTLLPREYTNEDHPITIRELIGYTPWYFNMPEDAPKYATAWEKILDTTGFSAPFGLTTVEQTHPYFQISYEGHECQWNGPSWPFATTQVLKSLSNFLNNYEHQGSMSKGHYYRLLQQYAASHTITQEDGQTQMWIDENLNPFTGEWIARSRLKSWDEGGWSGEKGGVERGKDYNHSGFCDLVISDLIGLKPQLDGGITIEPLTPDSWEWFCLDRVPYQGKLLTILWDKDGFRYNRGSGFHVLVDGEIVHTSDRPQKMSLKLGDNLVPGEYK